MLCTSNRRLGRAAAWGLAFVLIVTTGCSPAPDTTPVEAAVRQYNTQLIEAFLEHDMNLLGSVATREQAYTEYYQMAALGESGITLRATQRSIAFESVTFSGESSATAETAETWDYEHISTETSTTVRTETGVVYRLRYELVLQEGRWLVDKVTAHEDGSTPGTGGE